jgi:acylphosphatase
MQECLEATISGRVHMVMYRDFVCRKAKMLKLVGEVQNQRNGTVRVVAEGTRDTLEEFVVYIRRGPLLAQVKDVQVVWLPATHTFKTFSIRYE